MHLVTSFCLIAFFSDLPTDHSLPRLPKNPLSKKPVAIPNAHLRRHYLGKGTIGLEKDGKLYTVITDYRGIVVSVLDGREEVVSYDYGAFREELQRGDFASPWKFCSQRTNSVTGLIHFFKRVYDP